MLAKRFFFVSAGILCLALAYHLGASTATAQAPSNPIVAPATTGAFITANGDIYESTTGSNIRGPYVLTANVFGGSPPTTVTQQSWGQVKARYR